MVPCAWTTPSSSSKWTNTAILSLLDPMVSTAAFQTAMSCLLYHSLTCQWDMPASTPLCPTLAYPSLLHPACTILDLAVLCYAAQLGCQASSATFVKILRPLLGFQNSELLRRPSLFACVCMWHPTRSQKPVVCSKKEAMTGIPVMRLHVPFARGASCPVCAFQREAKCLS